MKEGLIITLSWSSYPYLNSMNKKEKGSARTSAAMPEVQPDSPQLQNHTIDSLQTDKITQLTPRKLTKSPN
jgi:hypothetical protein